MAKSAGGGGRAGRAGGGVSARPAGFRTTRQRRADIRKYTVALHARYAEKPNPALKGTSRNPIAPLLVNGKYVKTWREDIKKLQRR
jgi:hypothetical protein